jgi:hypothetical protein
VSFLPDEPEEAFGCGVLAGLELVADEVLQSVGLEGSGELAFCDFLGNGCQPIVLFHSYEALGLWALSHLDVALHITLDGLESSTADHIEESGKRLGGLEELCGVDSIVLLGVVVNVCEALAAIEVGAAGRESGGHVGRMCVYVYVSCGVECL